MSYRWCNGVSRTMLSHCNSDCFLNALIVTGGQTMFLESKEQLQSSCRRATSLKLLHKMWRMREGEQKGLQLSLSGHK